MSVVKKALTLKRLHQATEILRVVNVWDVASAKVVAALSGTRAIATAGHAIAASHGYADGEIPLELMLATLERIVSATELPVTADLDAGYGDPGETVRRAIGVGVVGANIEDRLMPLPEAVAAVRSVVAAAQAEGVDFQLNARTDAVLNRGERPLAASLADAIERGRAYLDAGASLVFVIGLLDRDSTVAAVEGLGRGKLSVIGSPGALTAREYEELGVARISYGPWPQRHALGALEALAESLYGEGAVPASTKKLT